MTIPEKLSVLRSELQKNNISAYVVPTADPHLSEYVGDHFKTRANLTDFTGSAGTLLVTAEMAGLWTDGRYHLQAAQQMEGNSVELFREGLPTVPSLVEFLQKTLPVGATLGFDGRMLSAQQGKKFRDALPGRTLRWDLDLTEHTWDTRPLIPQAPIWILEEKWCGCAASEKLAGLRQDMAKKNTPTHLLTTLDDIAWLLNLRGGDIPNNPVFLSYLLLTLQNACLFVEEAKLSDAVKAYLKALGVDTAPYGAVYERCTQWNGDCVLLDPERVNMTLYQQLAAKTTVVDALNPTMARKTIRNPVELENLRRCHVKDGVAVARFMKWLKENVGKLPMTELSIAAELQQLRGAQEGNLGPSFNTICGYAHHGAIIHYSASEQTNLPLQAEGLLLVDSGGQYYEGTTDITRTFALGPLTQEMRTHFTLVLRAMLSLASLRFPHGTTGGALDVIARQPLWEHGLNYAHGTGHGIGYLLNVHEGLQRFYYLQPGSAVLEQGMVITDEPGVYIPGSHGIRLENELTCRESCRNDFGKFLDFEVLTLAPLDLDAVDSSLLGEADRRRLNSYHETVYAALSPHMTEEEQIWLRHATRAI